MSRDALDAVNALRAIPFGAVNESCWYLEYTVPDEKIKDADEFMKQAVRKFRYMNPYKRNSYAYAEARFFAP